MNYKVNYLDGIPRVTGCTWNLFTNCESSRVMATLNQKAQTGKNLVEYAASHCTLNFAYAAECLPHLSQKRCLRGFLFLLLLMCIWTSDCDLTYKRWILYILVVLFSFLKISVLSRHIWKMLSSFNLNTVIVALLYALGFAQKSYSLGLLFKCWRLHHLYTGWYFIG